MFKKIIITLGVLLVLIVGGILIAPSFINWNAQFPRIAAQVKQATGRDLTIGGRLEVRLLPSPTLTARDVTLSNAPGASAAPMVKLDAVEIRMALLPLLSGQLQVERIRLINPVIRIEKLADGRSNLNFSPLGSKTISPTASSAQSSAATSFSEKQGTGLKLRFDNFKVVNATLIYHDARKDQTETISNLDATLRAASINGPFAAQGQGRVRGLPFTFDISLGQIIAERTLPLNAVLTGPAGVRAQVSGAILGLENNPFFKGTVKVTGDNLAAVVNAVDNTSGAPTPLRQPFELNGTLNAGARTFNLSELEIQLGVMRLSGQVKAKIGKTTTFKVALKAARIDVDRLLSAPRAKSSNPPSQEDGASRTSGTVLPPPPRLKNANTQQAFTLPKDISGTVSLNVDALNIKGGLISDLRLNAELVDGELALNQFQFQAPGVSDVAVFGFMRASGGKPQFDGNLEMLSSNPGGLADWLGVKMPRGVADRLKRISFKSKITVDPAQVSLSAIQLNGDRTEVTGGISVAFRARPSFGADLNIDTLNLDTYVSTSSVIVRAPSSFGAQALPKAVQQPQKRGAPAFNIATAWTALNALNDFDANLKLQLGRLTTGGRTFKNLAFDGTLYAGALNIRTLRLGAYQGASVNLSGKFNGFGGVPEMEAVKIGVKVKNVAALGTALGVGNIPRGVRALSLDARAKGSFLQPRLKVNVEALGGKYTVAGNLSFLPIGFGFNGNVTVRNPDAVKMLSALGYVPVGPLGALEFKAKLRTDGVKHDISALTGRIGDTPISGTLSLRSGGPKMQVTANLKTGTLDLARFLAKTKKRSKKRADAASSKSLLILAAYSRPKKALRADKRWSRKTFDLSVLNAVDGELTLKADALRFGAYSLENADIHAIVKDGVLTADRVTGRVFGGPVSGSAVVRAQGLPTLETSLKVDALNVGQAVKTIAKQDLAMGRLSLGVSFNANGDSPAALVSSLTGKGNLNIKALDVKKGGKGTALAPIIGLVAALNQFALPVSGKKKSGLADLSTNFDILNGVADVKNLTLRSDLGSGSGSGRIDIARWTIDFAGKMLVEPNILSALLSKGRVGREEVPFSVSGRLDNPGVKLGLRPAGGSPVQKRGRRGNAFQQILNNVLPGIAPAPRQTIAPVRQPAKKGTGGELAPPPPQQTPAPAPQKKLSPQEILIQKLMQGL